MGIHGNLVSSLNMSLDFAQTPDFCPFVASLPCVEARSLPRRRRRQQATVDASLKIQGL